ncbi:MAG: hypothetical protein LBK76_07920 [Verrucomicrobiales bacterium]|nr:hypothetical protein [Verrucomicrobiales bacterium]
MTSLAVHYVAGNITTEEKTALVTLLDNVATPLQIGDAVQTLKGSVSGKVVEILPDGCVKYQTACGIIIKTTPDALVKR